MSWSSSDNFFVNSKLEVFSADLFSEPLKMTQSKVAVYDGPKGDDFKRFLRSRNFRVNRQGKAIVRIQKRDDEGDILEYQYDSFVLEMVVPLAHFGFPNVPLPKLQAVNKLQGLLDITNADLEKKNDAHNELQSLLDSTKAELAKKNDELNDLQSLLDNTKAELAKKNDELNELRSLMDITKAELVKENDPLNELAKKNDELNDLRSLLDNTKAELEKENDILNELKKQKIDQDWNSEQFRLSIVSITNSMKRAFIDFGLEPPASGDPESVLKFLEMLRDLILHQEFGATFLVAVNGILDSIASIFDKRTGLSIGMETNIQTPAHLIKNLLTLRGFMDSHFFIDGSVIVRDFCLMNKDDLPVIFRDSATNVAELKQKKIGTKSIDNIDGNFIFYGYFNIPMVGMFKGVLTRVHVSLPDEIMVKLQVGGKHNLNDKRFWFVYANGSAIFEKKEPLSPLEPIDNNLQDVKFDPTRIIVGQTDFLEFLLRMNRIFVDKKGTYLKFEFIATKGSKAPDDNVLRYYDKDFALFNPFKLVQFDANECATCITERNVYVPRLWTSKSVKYAAWIVNEALGNDCSFTLKGIRFLGKITKVSDTFRNNALVSVFFEQSKDVDNCYVDALATTFFVLKTEKITSYDNGEKKALEFI
ncbi:uncharacterized protein LOC122081910 isoform X2 [Macadamia integrifolia]|uniref:uncharacterized protein LOC122081910 isoform X2 n=1 Tax=Macadamia integrifolia TaxID=60698 RepID=UPI001C4FC24D|nr:uncharacterized protein LOC122081910 isoform X2 [Macadamia integrifolia]